MRALPTPFRLVLVATVVASLLLAEPPLLVAQVLMAVLAVLVPITWMSASTAAAQG